MTEIYLHFQFAHYELYANVPVHVGRTAANVGRGVKPSFLEPFPSTATAAGVVEGEDGKCGLTSERTRRSPKTGGSPIITSSTLIQGGRPAR